MLREARRTQNSKQDKIQVVKSQPSVNSLREGQEVIYISKSNRLERYRKEKGRLWVSYMDTDNNYTVNKDLNVGGALTVDTLDVKSKITSYKIIPHNMQVDINTNETFLPWFGIKQGSDLTGVSTSFLAPYSMTLNKIMFRASAITSNPSANLAVKLYKMDDGDAVADVVSRATYLPDLAGDTFFVVNESDFDNNPKFEMGDNCGISIEAVSDYGGSIVWKITSVWKTEILI